ncbi:hypothetical protein [Hyalangium gracile]|uniref:hypothetical protein n=1 Tax=Hyalangium gracile TaxID=394092 RepID=UPI00295F485E|nr:hypothetical protein [Hyalangium gracile]
MIVRYYEAHPLDREKFPICAVARLARGQMKKRPESKSGTAILEYSSAWVFVVDAFRCASAPRLPGRLAQQPREQLRAALAAEGRLLLAPARLPPPPLPQAGAGPGLEEESPVQAATLESTMERTPRLPEEVNPLVL